MATVLLVIVSIAVLFLAGYGPTLLLLERGQKCSRLVAVPVVGLGSYIVVSHFLAGLHLTGRSISLISLAVFGVLLFVVPRNRRLDGREIRESLGLFAVCCAGLLLAIWPMLREGYGSYMAFGNADAAFNLAVYDDLQHHMYAERPENSVPYWPNAQFGHVFGAGYICVLLAAVSGADILKLHEVVSASLLFVAPASVFLFAVLGLKAPRKKGLLAAAASAFSSLVCYTFYLQSIGAMTFIALLPGLLAAWSEALETKGNRQILWTALLFAGASFGYYAAFPVMAVLLTVAATVALAKRTVGLRNVWRAGVIIAAVIAASYPALTLAIFRRSLVEAGSSRLVPSLNGPEVLLSFAFALTEQYLPFFWGVSIPPLALDSVFEAPAWGFFLALGLAALLCAIVPRLLFRCRATVPWHVRAQVLVLLAAVMYFFLRGNGYGTFKLAAWVSPVVLPFLVCGIAPGPALSDKARWLAWCRYGILIALIGLNVGWSVRLGFACLRSSTVSGRSLSGYSAEDFDGLRSLSKFVPPDSRILVAIPDAVVQRWAITYLRPGKLSAVPFLSLSPDEPDASEQLAAAGADSARYVLTWSARNGDVTCSRMQRPVWENARFQLTPMESVRNLLTVGRGWYRMESRPQSTQQWQHQFRWLRSYGELILLNASGEDLRLRLTIVSGYGQPMPDRSISVALNGEKFDEIAMSGFANVITKPFRARGFMNRLSLSLPDTAQPVPSRWGLFRRWVPRDGRRLNIAVPKIELLTAQDYQAIRMPCRLDFSRPDAWDAPSLTGIYPDGWIAREARVSLQPCGESDAISIQGFVPGLPAPWSPFPLSVSVNGIRLAFELSRPGPFTIAVPLPPAVYNGRRYDVAIGSPRTFVPAELGSGPDRRRLSIMLNAIELGQRPVRPATQQAKSPAGRVSDARSRLNSQYSR